MHKENLKLYLLVGFVVCVILLGTVFLHFKFQNNHQEEDNFYHQIDEQIAQVKEYCFELNGSNLEDNIQVQVTANPNPLKSTFYLQFRKMSGESQKSEIRYDFHYEQREILQHIYYQNELLQTNSIEIGDEMELSIADSSRLLSFFGSLMKEHQAVCEEDICQFLLTEDEKIQLVSLLDYVTFSFFREVLSLDIFPSVTISLNRELKQLEFVQVNVDETTAFSLSFSDFKY